MASSIEIGRSEKKNEKDKEKEEDTPKKRPIDLLKEKAWQVSGKRKSSESLRQELPSKRDSGNTQSNTRGDDHGSSRRNSSRDLKDVEDDEAANQNNALPPRRSQREKDEARRRRLEERQTRRDRDVASSMDVVEGSITSFSSTDHTPYRSRRKSDDPPKSKLVEEIRDLRSEVTALRNSICALTEIRSTSTPRGTVNTNFSQYAPPPRMYEPQVISRPIQRYYEHPPQQAYASMRPASPRSRYFEASPQPMYNESFQSRGHSVPSMSSMYVQYDGLSPRMCAVHPGYIPAATPVMEPTSPAHVSGYEPMYYPPNEGLWVEAMERERERRASRGPPQQLYVPELVPRDRSVPVRLYPPYTERIRRDRSDDFRFPAPREDDRWMSLPNPRDHYAIMDRHALPPARRKKLSRSSKANLSWTSKRDSSARTPRAKISHYPPLSELFGN